MSENSILYSGGTEKVLQIANQIDLLSEDFKNEYDKMYSMIEVELAAFWKGEDSEAFREKVGQKKIFFENMRETMCDYATFLRNTANAHEARAEDSLEQIDGKCDF